MALSDNETPVRQEDPFWKLQEQKREEMRLAGRVGYKSEVAPVLEVQAPKPDGAAPLFSDQELADDFRIRLAQRIYAVTEILNEAAAKGLIIGFQLGKGQNGKSVIGPIDVVRHY